MLPLVSRHQRSTNFAFSVEKVTTPRKCRETTLTWHAKKIILQNMLSLNSQWKSTNASWTHCSVQSVKLCVCGYVWIGKSCCCQYPCENIQILNNLCSYIWGMSNLGITCCYNYCSPKTNNTVCHWIFTFFFSCLVISLSDFFSVYLRLFYTPANNSPSLSGNHTDLSPGCESGASHSRRGERFYSNPGSLPCVSAGLLSWSSYIPCSHSRHSRRLFNV